LISGAKIYKLCILIFEWACEQRDYPMVFGWEEGGGKKKAPDWAEVVGTEGDRAEGGPSAGGRGCKEKPAETDRWERNCGVIGPGGGLNPKNKKKPTKKNPKTQKLTKKKRTPKHHPKPPTKAPNHNHTPPKNNTHKPTIPIGGSAFSGQDAREGERLMRRELRKRSAMSERPKGEKKWRIGKMTPTGDSGIKAIDKEVRSVFGREMRREPRDLRVFSRKGGQAKNIRHPAKGRNVNGVLQLWR